MLPDWVVIDGELFPPVDGQTLTFCCFTNPDWTEKYWQKSNYRKRLFVFAYDLLEYSTRDWRMKKL